MIGSQFHKGEVARTGGKQSQASASRTSEANILTYSICANALELASLVREAAAARYLMMVMMMALVGLAEEIHQRADDVEPRPA